MSTSSNQVFGSTLVETLRPFTAQGETSPGWLRSLTQTVSFRCDGSTVPGVASTGLMWCSGNGGESQGPCAPLKSDTVVCLGSPFSKIVDQITLTAPLPSMGRPASPALPYGLILADGSRCVYNKIRLAPPAWKPPTPRSVALYDCTGNGAPTYVYAEPGRDPIKRSASGWTVSAVSGVFPSTVAVERAIIVDVASAPTA